MKLLILTQKVDKEDPILGFFHNWILEFSKKFEKISVICLEKGSYDLPKNVAVFSLGKESGRSKIKYIKNFLNLILGLYKEYDSVFVHMNQEYVLLGGFIWKIMGKRVFLWRNHPTGDILTRVAARLSNKIFCTSKFSFVTKYKKTSLMPVGIDTKMFNTKNFELRKKNSVLFLGRISPIKKPDLLIEALNILNNQGIDFSADFYGDSLLKDTDYFDSVKNKVEQLGLNEKIKFYNAVPNYETPKIYNEHEIFVNLTPSGSFDKTILEAAACGCLLVVANKSLSGDVDSKMILEKENPYDIVEKINFWLKTDDNEKKEASEKLKEYVLQNHSLEALVNRLQSEIK